MENRKRILLVNDDGLDAPGLKMLAQQLGSSYDVYASAPDRQRSASSHRVTYFLNDLHACAAKLAGTQAAYRIDGTPADCTYAGINALYTDVKFDCVVSGINAGWNAASDIAYSGTVAAAMEGLFLGVPAMAVSLDDYDSEHGDYRLAASYAERILALYLEDEGRYSYMLNVNVPKDAVEGVEAAGVGGVFAYGRRLDTVREEDGSVRILRSKEPVPALQDLDDASDVRVIGRHCAAVSPLTRFGDVDREKLAYWQKILETIK